MIFHKCYSLRFRDIPVGEYDSLKDAKAAAFDRGLSLADTTILEVELGTTADDRIRSKQVFPAPEVPAGEVSVTP